jgi:regulator of protease activity HflC (stomatin/prohibitin superfamily)
MLWVIVSSVVSIVAAFGVVNGVGMRKQGRRDEGTMWIAGALVGWLVIVFGWGATRMFHEIPAGHVGVVYQFGGITGQVADGFQVTAPWQSVREASIQIQRATYELGRGNAAFSQESQDVFASATINYEVLPKDIQRLYRDVGPSYEHVLIEQRVFQTIKEETVRFRAVDVAPNREVIRRRVRDRLTQQLEPYSIRVVDFQLGNLDFDSEFKVAVRNKVIAKQKAQQALNEVQQAKYEAQKVLAAANGQARANRRLSRSLTPELVRYTFVQKLAPNLSVIAVPSGSIFNATNLFGPTTTNQAQP